MLTLHVPAGTSNDSLSPTVCCPSGWELTPGAGDRIVVVQVVPGSVAVIGAPEASRGDVGGAQLESCGADAAHAPARHTRPPPQSPALAQGDPVDAASLW
jgi:hypothetical protein